MTFQAHDGLTARSEDLHRHILRSHLAYLNQEETPGKLKQRHNLEALIAEFLSTVSHTSKFTFFEVTKILNDSIENNENFSAYKAGSAFEALEKYATNLISHPWRKEYKTIKLYSGFYKHFVECQLFGGSSVFRLLGYQFTEDGVLFLDEPVDPDKVARVALDCLIAYVECQVMVQICERVKAYKCTWFEINQVRQDYVCGVDEAVRILHQLKRNTIEQEKQERWLRDQENGSVRDDKSFLKPESSFQKTGILVDVSNTWPSGNVYSGYNNSSLGLQSTVSGAYNTKSHKSHHSKLPSWSEGVSSQLPDYPCRSYVKKSDDIDSGHEQSGYNLLTKCNNLDSRFVDPDLTPDTWKDSWEILRPYPERPDTSYRDEVRTGYGIAVPNVKETYSTQFGHMYPPHPMLPLALPTYPLPYDFNMPSRQCQQVLCDNQSPALSHKYHFPPKDDSEPVRWPCRSDSNHADDPDELCSSLLKMSIDVPTPSLKTRHFPLTSTYPSYQTTSNDVVLRPTCSTTQGTSKRGSYYDNVPSPFDSEVSSSFSLDGQSLSQKCDFQTNGTLPSSRVQKEGATAGSTILPSKPPLKKSYSNSSSGPLPEPILSVSLTNSLDTRNGKNNFTASSRESKGGKKWSCGSCTFHNAADKSICAMCGRSKHPGPENTPLVSGGRECPQCTLVNKKDSEDCTACGASLKDSPTYI